MTRFIAGPDPNPVKPKYVPPPGACDAHCHIFGPAAKFPYAPERRYTPPDSPKEKLRALHEYLGFARAVLVQASCHGSDNRAMLEAIAWSRKFAPGGAWRGVAMVGDHATERGLDALRAGGVRGERAGARVSGRKAVSRRDAVRGGAGRVGARARAVGNRLSPPQREDHAERRRAGRLLRESRPGRRTQKTDPGGQPGAALLGGRIG